MVGVKNYSEWGIKDSGTDISQDILDIANTASSFIVVGGYNFTFKTAGFTFFNILKNKVKNGIPVLMIIPANLPGKWSKQPQIIKYCLQHRIALILNGNNHSKWLLTEKDLYYGSSNFSETSWKNKIEVVSIHKHSAITKKWKTDTINDFKKFILAEINRLNNRPKMTSIKGLIKRTIAVWNKILPLVKKINPNYEKAIDSMKNLNVIEDELESLALDAFLFYNEELFNQILYSNNEILNAIIELFEFAYANIYNEFLYESDLEVGDVVETYNSLYNNFVNVVQKSMEKINAYSEDEFKLESNMLGANLSIINQIYEIINSSNT